MTAPGIEYLRQKRTGILGSIAGIVLFNVALIRLFQISSIFLLVLAELACLPVVVVLAYIATYRQLEREAAAMGAILAPDITNKWRFGKNILEMFLGSISGDLYPGELFEQVFEQWGYTVFGRVGFDTRIVTIEPEHIKSILTNDFDSFAKGQDSKAAMNSVMGDGIFNSDGDMWKFHRSMTRPFFSRDRITDFDIFEARADEAIKLMKERMREGYALDIQDVMQRFTLDSATGFLFGKCVGSLAAGLPYSPRVQAPAGASSFRSGVASGNGVGGSEEERFGETWGLAIQQALMQVLKRLRRGPLWPLISSEFWKDETEEMMAVVNRFIDPIIEEAVAKKVERRRVNGGREKEKEEEEEEEIFLDHLANLTDDKKILKDETLSIMLAARDTTSELLTFTLYVLSQHPDVLARLRAEILEVVGPQRRPTYDDIRKLKYVRAVLNETLRLYPIVAFNGRSAIKATTLANKADPSKPFYVPKGTRITYSNLLMHRRKDLWGPDADLFDPDRFLDERLHKYLTPNPFIFVPFHAGPRICIGQQFAYNESSFMLVRFLQNFDQITLAPESQPVESIVPARWATKPGRQGQEKFYLKAHLTIYAFGGIWMRLREAADSGNE